MGRLRYFGLTDKGPLRKSNEDALGIAVAGSADFLSLDSSTGCDCTPLGVLFIVSDGVGGFNAGEVASRMAVEKMVSLLSSELAGVSNSPTSEKKEQLLSQSINKVNLAVYEEANSTPERSKMAATLTLLWLTPAGITIAHAGDSRCYRQRESVFEQLTRDHSKVAAMVSRGEITAEQAKVHPKRNVIEQAIGLKPDRFKPDVESFDLQHGDRFLLCSDGLTGGLDNEHLAEYFADPFPEDLSQLGAELIRDGIRAYGRDNLTILLVEWLNPNTFQTIAQRCGRLFRPRKTD